MERSVNYKWVVILFFGIVGVMFLASVFYLATGRIPEDTYWGRSMKLPKTTPAVVDRSPSKVVLELNKGKKIGNRIVFYKGVKDDHLLLEVIIPELDGQYPYPFKIRLAEAEKGFSVADGSLRLKTLRNNFISVSVID